MVLQLVSDALVKLPNVKENLICVQALFPQTSVADFPKVQSVVLVEL